MKKEDVKNLTKAIRKAIEEVGLENFRLTPMFHRGRMMLSEQERNMKLSNFD